MAEKPTDRRASLWAIWAASAAFGTYFCMYGFRKPFAAASYTGADVWGIDFKTVVVSAQVLGYMVSKFIGIRVISEMPRERRAVALLSLIAAAELALVFFGLIPRPWNAACLFFNGLALGMVFGLVLSFLEGRELTEALVAGLCASFILADGMTKSVGTWLLGCGVPEVWMPCVAGLLFLLPLCIGVAMLTRIPIPSERDIQARTARQTLNQSERRGLMLRYAGGLTLLVLMFLLVTIARSIRADFAPEIWRGLGAEVPPSIFTRSETCVAIGVLVINGLSVYIVDNRRAFFVSLATCCLGFATVIASLLARQAGMLGAFSFMVSLGVGLYLPYVAMHTTIFERLLAMTRERGNLGFLMYLADAFGYLGYVTVMLTRQFWTANEGFLQFFLAICWVTTGLAFLSVVFCWRYFAARQPAVTAAPAVEGAA